ncbi:MAG: hypothetical protein MJ210_02200 [Alphaproteobacteria bacterium]|nr:hypothetical protein [Alphaproteobacteria bacterium]
MMPSAKQALKFCGCGLLNATIFTSKCAKYGLSFTSDLAKLFVGGAQNLADQFAPGGIKLGVGKLLYDKSEKIMLGGLSQLIAIQENAKKSLS